MANVRGRVARGALWLGGARIVNNLIGFLSTIILARLLTPADFGLVAIATGLLAILSSFTALSLSMALIQLDDPTDEHLHTAWTLNVARSAVIALLFSASAYPVALFYGEMRLVPVILVLAGAVFLSGFANPRIALLSKKLIFWQEFVLTAASKSIGFIPGLIIAWLYQSYWALVISTVAGQLAWIIVSYICAPYRPKFSLRHVRQIWSFSIWLTFCEILNTVNMRFDQLLVAGLLSRTALGYYTVGGNLASIPTRESTTPLTKALFPALVEVSSSRERLREAVRSTQSLIFCLTAPLGIGFALVADPMVRLVMGEKWLPAVMVIQAIASLYALQILAVALQPLAMAVGDTKLLFRRDLFNFLTRFPLVVAGLLLGGLPGLIFARVLAGLSHLANNMRVIHQLTDLTIGSQIRSVWRSLASLAAMIGAVTAVKLMIPVEGSAAMRAMELAAIILVGGAAYALAHALLWLASGREPGPESRILEMARATRASVRNAQLRSERLSQG